ncbi:hypothetical protein ABT124_15865 [Streptomyces sp. NPDC001982]|uniref:hypothetical protein n=1 Tax=Streptomyces sp. NPDC001982 TaxID=3154405 RepID=UPI00331F928D
MNVPQVRRLSRHAADVMVRRDIPVSDLADVFRHSAGTERHEGRWRVVGRNGLVAVLSDDGVIVTVLLRNGGQAWTDETARQR